MAQETSQTSTPQAYTRRQFWGRLAAGAAGAAFVGREVGREVAHDRLPVYAIISPGHGEGGDPGAIANGLHEVDLTRALSARVAAEFKRRGAGSYIIVQKHSDGKHYVHYLDEHGVEQSKLLGNKVASSGQRMTAARAMEEHALKQGSLPVYISIHFNAVKDPDSHGTMLFTGMPEVEENEIGRPGVIPATQNLAESIRNALKRRRLPVWKDKPIRYLLTHDNGSYPFHETHPANNPIESRVLVEAATISHNGTADAIKSGKLLDQLAVAIVDGAMAHAQQRLHEDYGIKI